MEKLNYSGFRELRSYSSFVIKNTSLGIKWSIDENKMPLNSEDSQYLQRYIHIINV